jgi:hypothetical protein
MTAYCVGHKVMQAVRKQRRERLLPALLSTFAFDFDPRGWAATLLEVAHFGPEPSVATRRPRKDRPDNATIWIQSLLWRCVTPVSAA